MDFISVVILLSFVVASFFTAQLWASREDENALPMWPITTLYRDRSPVFFWVFFWGVIVLELTLFSAVMVLFIL
jgi:hypothetical protein